MSGDDKPPREALVRVKPLEWRAANHGVYFAKTVVGIYSVGFDDGWWAGLSGNPRWDWTPEQDPRSFSGPLVAQAACQAHFEHRILSTLFPVPDVDEADTRRIDALRDESWDLRCFSMPTGGDDADIGWRVIGHWQAKPHEREVGVAYTDDPRAAIDDALARKQAPAEDNTDDTCPICANPLKPDDICATDIELGTCHATCLAGAPIVDLESGEASDGPVTVFRYGDDEGQA